MKNLKKKGFTLVELLVVIAIIAILAVVSVVGYTSFIKKANLSNDQATIEMLNDNLDALFVTGKPETAGEAISALRPLGVFGDKYAAYSDGYHYVYDLENNQFVLFDDNDTCVYPKDATVGANLWALYADQPHNKVEGISNYVAITSIQNTTALAQIFGTEGTFKFDLNSYPLKYNIHAGVTVSNGVVAGNINVATDESSVASKEVATFSDDAAGYADKVLALQGKKILQSKAFTNCVIEINSNAPVAVQDRSATVVFDGCTFVGSGKWAVEVTYGSVTFKNCKFINSGRGLNVFATANTVVIENCTFELGDGEKANAIQIATSNGALKDEFNLTVKNNQFISANSAVVIHEGIAKVENAATIADKVTFSGNTYGNIRASKVLVDPDADSAEVAKITPLADALAAKIK